MLVLHNTGPASSSLAEHARLAPPMRGKQRGSFSAPTRGPLQAAARQQMQWGAPQLLQVELGPSFFIPNNQIGSFGAITQFKCLLRNNRDMFDISGAGIFSAAAVSIALFAVGLAWSTGADVPRVSLRRQRWGHSSNRAPCCHQHVASGTGGHFQWSVSG